MTQKTQIISIEKLIDDIDLSDEIILLLNKNEFIRRTYLIAHLQKTHTREIKTGPEDRDITKKLDDGYSLPTINKKIKELVDGGKILSLSHAEISKLYIVNEYKTKNASYFITKENFELTSEIKHHLETNVFSYLMSGNSVEKRAALWEIESYDKRFDLTHEEIKRILEVLAQEAENDDNELINLLVQFIYNELITKKRVVIDKKEFLSTFRVLLEKYSEFNEETNKIREKVLVILSYLGDDIVVSKLKDDIDSLDDLSEVENGYCSPFAAKMIEDHRAELFDLEIKFANEGKTDTVNFIRKVRDRAKENLNLKEPLLINEFLEKTQNSSKGEDAE